jgi:UDP-N-acetylglucosamine 2-epimerase
MTISIIVLTRPEITKMPPFIYDCDRSNFGYLDFLQLNNNVRLRITDFNGIRKESCFLKKPCLIIRGNTDRLETIKIKANKIIGWKTENIIKEIS